MPSSSGGHEPRDGEATSSGQGTMEKSLEGPRLRLPPQLPSCKMRLLFLILGLCPILCGALAHLAIGGWVGHAKQVGPQVPAEIMSPGLGLGLLFIYGDEGVRRGFCLGFGWKIIRHETTVPGEPNRPSPLKPPQHPDCAGGQSGTSSLSPGESGRFQ